MFTIRDAVIDDLPAIVAIYNSTVAGRMVTADMEPVSVESRLPWFHAHEPVHRPLWVVEIEGETVAWVSFQSFYGRAAYCHTAEISAYITEAWRSRGLGSELLAYAETQCEKLDIKTLLGYVFGHNKPSLRVLEKHGFSVWGHFPNVAELDGVERDLLILGKRVRP